MVFTKRLREGVREGRITCTVRFWTRLQVKVGGRYRMDEGQIEVDSIEPIGMPDVTPELARESGFLGLIDLLKVAKHGKGEKIYLIRFHYVPPGRRKGLRPPHDAQRPISRRGRPGTVL
ncbi:MAG TPA: ASCH domain-containing protein [Terracidiphilus sp.]|nr:ASCH domain-containing protein [Terracidiphilus sp.]